MYMHKESGDVASLEDWNSDYVSMDPESWFGKDASDITDSDYIAWITGGHLIAVVKDNSGEWVES